jgi:hypothetical protein
MSLAERKRLELVSKLSSLTDEIAVWVTATEANSELEKHYSQVRRLRISLQAAIDQVSPRVAPGQDALESWTAIEVQVLGIHQVWDQFRTKLAMRYVPALRPHLDLADDLAWECYRPAVEVAIAAGTIGSNELREPPLLYFTSFATPFTVVRGSMDVTAGQDVLSNDDMGKVLRQLPVPLIGIPWFQLAHLPDTAVVAHEAGHDVEADLGLTKRIVELIEANTATRAEQWRRWASEIFADVWATLNLGDGFVSALLDLIATPPAVPPTGFDHYPPPTLRAVVVCEVLRQMGGDGERFLTRWEQDVEPLGDAVGVEDGRAVAGALCDGTFAAVGGKRLRDVVPDWAPEQSRQDANRLAGGLHLEGKSVGGLVAAAALAFEADAPRYVEAGFEDTVRARIAEVRGRGVRGHDPLLPQLADGSEEARLISDGDRAKGQSIIRLLTPSDAF